MLQRKNEIRNSKEAYKRAKEKITDRRLTCISDIYWTEEVLGYRDVMEIWKLEMIIVKLKQTVTMNRLHLIIVTRSNIVWKLARGYCLCYCRTFSLVPDSTKCTKIVLLKSAVHCLCHLKSNNIIGQRKTTNKEKHFYPGLTSFNLQLSCT